MYDNCIESLRYKLNTHGQIMEVHFHAQKMHNNETIIFSEFYRTPLFRFFLHTKLIPRIIDASDTRKGAGHPLQIWPGNRLLTGLFSGFCE